MKMLGNCKRREGRHSQQGYKAVDDSRSTRSKTNESTKYLEEDRVKLIVSSSSYLRRSRSPLSISLMQALVLRAEVKGDRGGSEGTKGHRGQRKLSQRRGDSA